MKNNSVVIAIVAFLTGAAVAWFMLSSQQPVALGQVEEGGSTRPCQALSQAIDRMGCAFSSAESCGSPVAGCEHICVARQQMGC